MIASLRGIVVDTGLQEVVIECAGVGHAVAVAPATVAALRRGEEAHLLTELVLRDDALLLYGFRDAEERRMFRLLRTVSGLGPQLALGALAVLEPAEIAAAITEGDARRLQAIPRVGKRVADRLIVELRDKVSDFVPSATSGSVAGAGGDPVPGAEADPEVHEALLALGFAEKEAARALAAAPTAGEADTATRLRAALAVLGRKGV